MGNKPICFWELASNNAEASVGILKKIINWEIKYDGKPNIYDIKTGERVNELDGIIFTLSVLIIMLFKNLKQFAGASRRQK